MADATERAQQHAEASAYHAQAMRRVAETPPPAGQKFAPGQRVRIDDDLGFFMRHFPAGVEGTVHHTYAHAYGGTDDRNLRLYCIEVDGHGRTAWYYERQLSAVAQRPCWPVWAEGYRFIPPEGAQAKFLGWWPGDTFAEACAAWAAQSPLVTDSYRFDAERLTWWGRRLFDNEAQAREHFG